MADPVATPTPAADKVFVVTELLEKILLGLDTKTLLVAQRVNSTFKDLIAQSSPLQKKLFFKPVASIDEAMELGFLDSGALVLVKRTYTDPVSGKIEDPDTAPIKAFLNTLMLSTHQRYALEDDEIVDLNNGTKSMPLPTISKQLSISSTHGSWEQMLISQPPLKKVLVEVTGRYHDDDFHGQ